MTYYLVKDRKAFKADHCDGFFKIYDKTDGPCLFVSDEIASKEYKVLHSNYDLEVGSRVRFSRGCEDMLHKNFWVAEINPLQNKIVYWDNITHLHENEVATTIDFNDFSCVANN